MIASILRLSIERRGVMMLFALFVAFFGMYSYQQLPIDAVPDITNVQVQINTATPGYSPLETEQRVTFIVETSLAGLPNLSYTRSISRYGLSQVTVVFKEETDLYFARNLVNERLNAIAAQLPIGLTPEMGPIATGLGEIYMYSLSAEPQARQDNGMPYDAMALREIHDWVVKPQLSLVEGVTEVYAIGGFEKQYHVNPNPVAMINFGISTTDLISALERNNANQGAGFVEQNGQQVLIRSKAQLKGIDDIGQVVVKIIDGIPVKLIASLLPGKSKLSSTIYTNIHLLAKMERTHSEDYKAETKIAKLSLKAQNNIIDNLFDFIKKLSIKEETEWGNYYDKTNYNDAAFQGKKTLIEDWVTALNPQRLIDIGGNDGTFARTVVTKVPHVIVTDIDSNAVGYNYKQIQQNKETNMLAFVCDVLQPAPGIGLNNSERSSLVERLKGYSPDVTMALALIHHITLSGNVPFDRSAQFLSLIHI